jgi:cell division protein FtsN
MSKKRKPESRSRSSTRSSQRRTPARASDSSGLFRGVFVASAIGGTFALGLSLGHSGPGDGDVVDNTAGTLLAIADEQTNRYEAVKSSLKLTFHEQLTTPVAIAIPSPRDARPSTRDAPPSTKEVAASPPPRAAEPPSAASAPVAKAAPVVEPVRLVPQVADNGEGESNNETSSLSRDERKARLQQALARLSDDGAPPVQVAAAAKPAPAKTTAPPLAKERAPAAAPAASSDRYLVQVASLPSETNARALADKLQSSGRRVRVIAAEVDGQGTVYRVQVTGFSSSVAAEKALHELAATGIKGLVRKDG